MKFRDDLFLFLGRLSFAALFIPNGYRQLLEFSRFSASLGHQGLPFPDVVAALALASQLGGTMLLVLGYEVSLGSFLLIAFCIGANLTAHRYWAVAPDQQGSAMLQFYKNVAICGGLLFLCVSGPGRWSLAGRIPSLSRYLPGRTR